MNILLGIASTTHVDMRRERLAKCALDDMANQIKDSFIPLLIEHRPEYHIGVILYGEVFQLKDQEYALGVVSGVFESDEEKETFETGISNFAWKQYSSLFDKETLFRLIEDKLPIKTDMIHCTQTQLTTAELLEIHLNSTKVSPDGTVYKIKRFIETIGDLRIEVYPKDHKYQPHFHVISKQRGLNARFDLETLEYINSKRGKIRADDISKVKNFFTIRPMALNKLRNEHRRLN